LYLNTSAHKIEGNPEWPDTSSFGFEGVRTSFKYALTRPYTDAVGIAIYVEPEYSRRFKTSGEAFTEWALENKLIFQKNFSNDRVVTALNLTAELATETQPASEVEEDEEAEFESELALEGTAGISYRVANGWFLGLEGRP